MSLMYVSVSTIPSSGNFYAMEHRYSKFCRCACVLIAVHISTNISRQFHDNFIRMKMLIIYIYMSISNEGVYVIFWFLYFDLFQLVSK